MQWFYNGAAHPNIPLEGKPFVLTAEGNVL